MKKVLVLLIVVMALVFSACATEAEQQATQAGTPEAPAAAAAPAAEAPAQQAGGTVTPAEIYRGPPLRAGPEGNYYSIEEINRTNNLPIAYPPGSVTLTIFQQLNLRVDDFSRENNLFTQMLEDATGLSLEFVTAPANPDDARTVRNLLMASGDYPDVMSVRGGFTLNEMAMFADQGVFVPLDEYIEIWGVNTRDVFERYPAARHVTTGLSGHIYALPDVNDCFHCVRGEARAWYHMPWLESLNGGVFPETTEELKDLMIRMRDEDPDGTGVEVFPIAWRQAGNWNAIQFFANSFQNFPRRGFRVNDDGTIEAAFMNDYFRQTLEFMRDLYAERLILPESFSIDNDSFIALGEDPAGVRYGIIIGWGPEDGVRRGGERWYQYFVLPPVQGPTGARYAMATGPFNAVMPAWFVTDRAQNVEAAVRLGDLLLSEYYGYSAYFGLRGLSWDYARPGDMGLNGLPAVFRQLTGAGTQEINSSWDQTSLSNRDADFRLSQYAEGADIIYRYLRGEHDLHSQVIGIHAFNEIFKFYGSQVHLYPFETPTRNIVPPLLHNEDDARIIADVQAVIEPFILERVALFVTGADDLETGFDRFVSDLEALGVGRMVEAMQRSFDAGFR